MSDDPKDSTNQDTNQAPANKRSVNVTELSTNKSALKGKKTDIQNPELVGFSDELPDEHHW